MQKKKIHSIQFLVMSPQFIRKMSALEIKTPDTYDKDGYPMEGGLMDPHLGVINPGLRCKTCGQKMKFCPGHFGSLELVRPVIHSEFGRRLEILMHVSCQSCGRVVLPESKLDEYRQQLTGENREGVTKKILAKARKIKTCPHCNSEKRSVLLDRPTNFYLDKDRIYPTQIREWVEKIPDKDLILFGYNPEIVRPEWFIITVMPVPPITIRPSITLESGIKSEDDLTHKLVDIIRINMRLKDNIEAGAPQLIIEDLWDLLQYHVTTYFDNNTAGVPPAKHRSGRALRTLVQRLKGKKGRFRHNLTGKRVNFAARSTVTPDPFLSISELGVPKPIAEELTVPVTVTEWNKEEVKHMVEKTNLGVYLVRPNETRKKIDENNKTEVLAEIDVGFKVERQLQDGDIVLFNRQPSLHRLSMLAHKVKVMSGKTFRINPIVCRPYNADFDGDEMNMHVPQTEEGKTEARELMLVENQVISPRYGAPVIVFEEDGISGAFILTMKNTSFAREDAMQFFYEIGIDDPPKPDRGKRYSGRLLFSQLLPKDLNLEYPSATYRVLHRMGIVKDPDSDPYETFVRIQKGQLVSGVIDKASFGETQGKLIDYMARNYPSSVIEQFYYRLNRIVNALLTKSGMTIGLAEYKLSDELKRERKKIFDHLETTCEEILKKYQKGTLDLMPGRDLRETFEMNMIIETAKAKEKMEKLVMAEKIKDVLTDDPVFNNTVMILSGSRGSGINLMNIAGFWGQASVREGRPKRGYKNRLITLNNEGDVGTQAGGFITTNFMEGMNPKEYFYHSMGGRQGEVDTGVSTKVSGYLYRRLANSLKDLLVSNDTTVRTASKGVIQFIYGEDGVFPKNSNRGKTLDVPALVEKVRPSKKGKD